jgi:hypothetical protein
MYPVTLKALEKVLRRNRRLPQKRNRRKGDWLKSHCHYPSQIMLVLFAGRPAIIARECPERKTTSLALIVNEEDSGYSAVDSDDGDTKQVAYVTSDTVLFAGHNLLLDSESSTNIVSEELSGERKRGLCSMVSTKTRLVSRLISWARYFTARKLQRTSSHSPRCRTLERSSDIIRNSDGSQ